MKSFKTIIFIILFLLIDFAIWIGIGFILLNYEDFYDETKGAYFSFESMTLIEIIAYVAYYLWIILNIILVMYLAFRLIKKTRFLPKQE